MPSRASFDTIKRLGRSVLDLMSRARGRIHERVYGLLSLLPVAIGTGRTRQGLVVSLTTIPDRLDTVHLAIESMLRQSCKPEKVILWLDQNADLSSLPEPLARQKRKGLEICQRKDIGPYTKLVYCLREYPDHLIVTVDDDFIYRRHLLRDLLATHRAHPDCVACDRAHLMLVGEDEELLPYNSWQMFSPGRLGPSHCLFPTGVGGVLYAPGHLHPDVTRDDLFLRFSPKADDVWFKIMALLQETKVIKTRRRYRFSHNIQGTLGSGLFADNLHRSRNDDQISAVIEHYGKEKVLRRIRQCQDGRPEKAK